MHYDSARNPIQVGNKVRFRGQIYTIKEFSDEKGPYFKTPVLIFEEESIHTDEIPEEAIVDLVKE